MSNALTGVHTVAVPAAANAPLVPPSPARVRALKRHLIESIRDMREARHPERLVQKRGEQPEGFAAEVLRAGCTQCRGNCCQGGGDHAYLDDRTMARVRAENPDLEAGAIIGLYVRSVATEGYESSCLFHGRFGCTLAQPLRAELCNAYYCNGLRDFLRMKPLPEKVEVVASRKGVVRRDTIVRHGRA